MVARRLFVLLATLLSAATQLAAQETGIIVGRVTDASTQQPVPSVSVYVGSRGTLTDAQGRYRIAGVAPGQRSVRAVTTGYRETTQTVTVVSGQTVTADFALAVEAIALSELVAVGYGTQRAANVTGSVEQVSADQFNTGRVVSPEELIQGKVAGVQVVDNNEPGGGISIRIRGATSINASSDPLFVVDGVPLGTGAGAGLSAGRNSLAFINPADIESITVLKDAAAAAIYGANAANGVVLITTKSGQRGIGIEYNGSISGSTITREPEMLTAEQFRTAVTQYAPGNVAQLQNANTNWFDQITRNAMGQEHNVAFSSAGETSTYRLSVGYLNQDGVIQGTTIERLSGAFNYNQRLFEDRSAYGTARSTGRPRADRAKDTRGLDSNSETARCNR